MPETASVRPRRSSDLPALADVLAGQQPHSRYPLRWPLPFPPEEFIVRPSEQQAWVAELDGQVVGHVSLTTVEADALGDIWSAGAGRPVAELACVSVLFVDHERQGHGIGGRLLDTAVTAAREAKQTPVLDVVTRHSAAVDVYRHRGWVEVGRARPEWLPDGEPDVLLMVLPESC